MTTPTGREPSLPANSSLTGREPGLGKDALQKHLPEIPLLSWDDPRIQWGNVRAMRFTLTSLFIPPLAHLQSDAAHPLIDAMRMFQTRGVIQLLLSPYRGLFLRINTVDTISTPFRIEPFDVQCELTVMGQITELDLLTFPEGVIFPDAQRVPEYVRVGFRYLHPPTSLGYFNPVID